MAKQVFTFERRKRKKRKGIHSKNNKPKWFLYSLVIEQQIIQLMINQIRTNR